MPVPSSRRSSTPASTSASPTPGRRRCTSSPPSTTCPPCGASSASSRAWSPAPPTATGGWPGGRPRPCCTSGPGSATGWPTCTTRGGPARRSSTWWATTPPTTPATTRRCESDIASIASAVSGWYRSTRPGRRRGGGRRPRRSPPPYGPPGCVATLVLPGRRLVVRDLDGPVRAAARCAGPPWSRRTRSTRSPRRCARASARRSSWAGTRCAPRAWRRPAGSPPATGAALLGETFPANLERGAGHPAVERLAYLAEMAQAQLDGVRHLSSSTRPLPSRSSPTRTRRATSCPTGCTVHTLARSGEDAAGRAGGAGRGGGRRGRRRRAGAGFAGPSDRAARSPPRRWPPPSGPRCPRAPSWSTRATRRGSSSRARRRAPRATTGSR